MSTRTRRLIAATCAAASLGFGLVGPTGAAAAPSVALAVDPPRPEPDADGSRTSGTMVHSIRPMVGYRSRPDLVMPRPSVTNPDPAAASSDMLVSSTSTYIDGFGKNTLPRASVVDATGRTVWISTEGASATVPITFAGQPALAYLASDNWIVVDGSYQPIGSIPRPSGMAYLRGLLTTDAAGTRALVSGTRRVAADLSAYQGPKDGQVDVAIVQEIDLRTGAVLFSWDSWSAGPGHIPLTDTLVTTLGNLLPYVNPTGLAYDSDGNILISATGTGAVHKLDKATGAIVWSLGGKRDSFTYAEGTRAPRSPRAVLPRDGGELLLLDRPEDTEDVRVASYRIDTTAMTAVALEQVEMTIPESHDAIPQPITLQILANGHTHLSATNRSREFTPEGTEVLGATGISAGSHARRAPWHGTPQTLPDAAVEMAEPGKLSVHASWNGSTEVASWRVSVGPKAGQLRPFGTAPRNAFETTVTGDATAQDAVVRVEALDADGKVLATAKDQAVTPLHRKYAALGGPNSSLGQPTSLIEPWLGGIRRHFEHGDLYWRADTGVSVVSRDMAEVLDTGGTALGFPRTGTRPTPDGRGSYLLLPDGGLYQRDGDRVFTILGDMWRKYSAMGWEKGPWGSRARTTTATSVPPAVRA